MNINQRLRKFFLTASLEEKEKSENCNYYPTQNEFTESSKRYFLTYKKLIEGDMALKYLKRVDDTIQRNPEDLKREISKLLIEFEGELMTMPNSLEELEKKRQELYNYDKED